MSEVIFHLTALTENQTVQLQMSIKDDQIILAISTNQLTDADRSVISLGHFNINVSRAFKMSHVLIGLEGNFRVVCF